MSDRIDVHTTGTTRILTINAPAKRNALSVEMRIDLHAALEAAMQDDSCRAIILTGAEGGFCAGGQLKTGPDAPPPDAERTRKNVAILHDIARLLLTGPKPTFAAVDGAAFGAGFSLAAACDFVIATPEAKFCAAFCKVGLVADAGLMWSLPQRIGPGRARDIIMTGRVVKAEEAAWIGLVNKIVAPDALLEETLAQADRFAQIAPLATAAAKSVLGAGPSSLEDVFAAEADIQPRLSLSSDYNEGRAAFKEKRPPVFRGT